MTTRSGRSSAADARRARRPARRIAIGPAVLVSPGPVDVSDAALVGLPHLHHRSAAFRAVLDESSAWLREMLGTARAIAFFAASGTGGMEAIVANATRPGDRVLVVSGGRFGDRWAEIARAYGRGVSVMRIADGAAFPLDEAIERARRERPDAVALTHVESSTGSLAPVREITRALGRDGPIVIVDAISSAGAEEIRMDEWGIDALVGASQKALGAPAGACFVALSEQAAERAPREGFYYFDLARYADPSGRSAAPFTPAIRTMQILHRSLSIMRKTGFDAVRERHRRAAEAFTAACEALGLRPFAENPSSAVQVLLLPKGCGSDALLGGLERRGFVAAGGQGGLAGKVVRTGFLGIHDARTLAALVAALGEALEGPGCAPDGREAARRIARFSERRPLFDAARAGRRRSSIAS